MPNLPIKGDLFRTDLFSPVLFNDKLRVDTTSDHLSIHFSDSNSDSNPAKPPIWTGTKKPSRTDLQVRFNEWLAGLIDGDGCFNLSKKGYASLEITVELRDQACLFQIKDKFGGSVKVKQGQKWLRYRLHHKNGLLALINAVNGLIRNPNRLLQLDRICDKYGLTLKYPSPLTYSNGWLSGFLDADGSIYLNTLSGQIFITASQKNKLLLDPLVELYGGTIYTMSKVHAFKWVVYSKEQVLDLTEYFDKYPLRSKKMVRIRLINSIYAAFKDSAHNSSSTTIKGKIWNRLIKKWENFS